MTAEKRKNRGYRLGSYCCVQELPLFLVSSRCFPNRLIPVRAGLHIGRYTTQT